LLPNPKPKQSCKPAATVLSPGNVSPLVATTDHERVRRTAQVQQAEADFEPIPFDASAARAFGHVAASLRRSGRKPAARACDALIAATAIANGLPLYTCDPDDFGDIDGLDIRVVPVPTDSRQSFGSSLSDAEFMQ
jgi:tRNA(fMet)-specific endonuclease VapC